MSGTASDYGKCIYLHLSDNTPAAEEEITLADGNKAKVLWKDILVEGEYPMSPGPNGASSTPMRVIAEGESDAATKTISMSDLQHAHKDGAFKYVTVPTKHRDDLLDNTGYVPRPDGLRVVEKAGKKVLQAALGFTEPDIKGKVQRGTIPDVSAGVFFNWLNKHTTKRYRAALKHVALTPTPFMGNLDGFAPVFASDDELNSKMDIEIYEFESGEESGSEENNPNKNEVVWDATTGMEYVKQKLGEALNPSANTEQAVDDGRPSVARAHYYVQDISPDKALVEEYFKGSTSRFVIPYTRENEEVKPSSSTRWVEVREAMIAASDYVGSTDITDKLTAYLAENFGADNFRVASVSLDYRARVENTVEGGAWLAPFSLFADGAAVIAPPSRWEAIELPSKPEKDEVTEQPASSKETAVTFSDDPMFSRVQAARNKRRQLVAS